MDRIGVFISYAHEDEAMASALAAGLTDAGYSIWIDKMELRIGDSLLERIATAIEAMEFLVGLISEASVESNWCKKELALGLSDGLNREGVKVLPVRVGDVAVPAMLKDTYCPRLDPENLDPIVERLVGDIRSHHEERLQAEAAGEPLPTSGSEEPRPARATGAGTIRVTAYGTGKVIAADEPIRIIGIVKEGVGQPRDDGTQGSALYRVPLRLSRVPSTRWSQLFVQCWNHPPEFSTMHRPGIASVSGDTVILEGTTLDELEQSHAKTMKLCVNAVNDAHAELVRKEGEMAARKEAAAQEHQRAIDEAAERIKFDE